VLLLLFERAGKLRVLLTTRSKTLRSHPGQTALPGGRMDETDTDAIHTAVRWFACSLYTTRALKCCCLR
jgi:peroxisomal coenzyme A diphosphatase NUDT7